MVVKKLQIVLLADYVGLYDSEGKLYYGYPHQDIDLQKRILEKLGYELSIYDYKSYRLTAFKNELPESIDVVHTHVKVHNKLK